MNQNGETNKPSAEKPGSGFQDFLRDTGEGDAGEGDLADAADEGLIPEDGFSLEALSQAYAQAVESQNTSDTIDDQGEEEGGEGEFGASGVSQDDDDASDTEHLAAEEAGAESDVSDDAPFEVSPSSIVEAMLFVGDPDRQPLDGRKIAALLRGVSPDEVVRIVDDLNAQYEQQNTAYRIVEIDGGFRMELAQDVEAIAEVMQRFYKEVRPATLAQAAIDVLAVVAYNQPISAAEVEKIRGKSSGSVLNQLVRRNLLVKEKSTQSPKQTDFKTTQRFLEMFEIESIDDLPLAEEVEVVE